MKYLFFLIIALLKLLFPLKENYEYRGLQPWDKNPFYWEYNGKPVLLIGGTDNDNLFPNDNV